VLRENTRKDSYGKIIECFVGKQEGGRGSGEDPVCYDLKGKKRGKVEKGRGGEGSGWSEGFDFLAAREMQH